MNTIRNEVVTYVRICEYLLSRFIDPALNQDERDLIVYYVVQLAQKFEYERSSKTI